jgi:hypothetical protein
MKYFKSTQVKMGKPKPWDVVFEMGKDSLEVKRYCELGPKCGACKDKDRFQCLTKGDGFENVTKVGKVVQKTIAKDREVFLSEEVLRATVNDDFRYGDAGGYPKSLVPYLQPYKDMLDAIWLCKRDYGERLWSEFIKKMQTDK